MNKIDLFFYVFCWFCRNFENLENKLLSQELDQEKKKGNERARELAQCASPSAQRQPAFLPLSRGSGPLRHLAAQASSLLFPFFSSPWAGPAFLLLSLSAQSLFLFLSFFSPSLGLFPSTQTGQGSSPVFFLILFIYLPHAWHMVWSSSSLPAQPRETENTSMAVLLLA